MTKRMQAILRGAGSIMDIYPAPGVYEKFIPKGTPEERLRAIWTRVGGYIRHAAGEVRDESRPRKDNSST